MMLKFAKLERSQDRVQILEDFNPQTDRWIVSDLRSKLEIQKAILRRDEALAGDPVLRSSELWSQIFQRAYPDKQILQDEWFNLFARKLLQGQLEKNKIGTAVELMRSMVPIFLHPERANILNDVLGRDESALGRWGEILPFSIQIFSAAYEKNWVGQSWIPALLGAEELPVLRDKRRYIFDLGASLTSSEAELIQSLAKHQEVLVLLPRPQKIWQRFDYLLQPGELLAAQGSEQKLVRSDAATESDRRYLRFSGRVAELKESVAQVREWLDAGVGIEKIAIVTPNFEMDFPVLEEHFRVEGIPLDRASSRRVQTHRALQKWTSKLRLWREDLRFKDLVSSFQDGSALRSETFEALFKNSAFLSDLSRAPKVQEAATEFLPPAEREGGELSLPAFFDQASQYWEDREFQDLERLFESVSEATPGDAALSFEDWIEWTELQLSRLEVSPIDEGGERLAVTSLQNADSLAWTHRIFLSLVDQLPDRKPLSFLSSEEILVLGWTHGFFLPHPEQSLLQFELEWLLGEGRGDSVNPGQDVFSYPMTDWQGKPTAPQPFVLKGLGDDHSPRTPKLTRWDELQRQEEKPADPDTKALPFGLGLNLSVSSVSRYLKCPFIFKAEKIFSLVDPSVVDLELDPRTKGSLIHELFDKLLQDPVDWDRSLEEIAGILDTLRTESKDFFMDEGLWIPFRKKWSLAARRFLTKEKAYFESYPGLQVLGRELDFKVAYNPVTKVWRAGDRETPNEVLFRGKIDRIDGVEGKGVILYDYKSTVKPEHNFSNWLKEDELQMSFYSWLVEEGFVNPSWKDRVQGAVYYSLKELERRAGFQHAEGVDTLFAKVRPSKFSDEDLSGSWDETRKRIEEATAGILAGEFAPKPKTTKTCGSCRWRGLCRAPHLTL